MTNYGNILAMKFIIKGKGMGSMAVSPYMMEQRAVSMAVTYNIVFLKCFWVMLFIRK